MSIASIGIYAVQTYIVSIACRSVQYAILKLWTQEGLETAFYRNNDKGLGLCSG